MVPKLVGGINYTELKKETKIMKQLIHSHIVRYLDSYEAAYSYNIIVEYMDRGDLRQLLDRGRLNESTIVRMIEQILKLFAFSTTMELSTET